MEDISAGRSGKVSDKRRKFPIEKDMAGSIEMGGSKREE